MQTEMVLSVSVHICISFEQTRKKITLNIRSARQRKACRFYHYDAVIKHTINVFIKIRQQLGSNESFIVLNIVTRLIK